MSKPRYGWWSYAKHMVRKYPELKKEYEVLHDVHITARITGVSRNDIQSNPTERAALRELPAARQREYDAVEKAINLTRTQPTGSVRLMLIDLVFWKRTHNITGASLKLHISESTAINYHTDFIRLVGFCYGLEDE